MHVVFIEPRFPVNQRFFVKALREVGATVTAIGEGSKDSLSGDMRQWLSHYEQVDSVVNEGAVLRAAKFIHARKPLFERLLGEARSNDQAHIPRAHNCDLHAPLPVPSEPRRRARANTSRYHSPKTGVNILTHKDLSSRCARGTVPGRARGRRLPPGASGQNRHR